MGYGQRFHSLEDFLGSIGLATSPDSVRHRASGLTAPRICLGDLPTHLPRLNHRPGWSTFLRHPIAALIPIGSVAPKRGSLSRLGSGWAVMHRYRNINRLSIDYASRPRLRSRLTLGGLAFPRKPWAFGGRVSHPSLATHASILTRVPSTTVSTTASPRTRRSPTNPVLRLNSAASV